MLFLEWKERAFIEKVNSRCFFLISSSHIGRPKRYNMASPYKALQRCVKRFGKELRNYGPQRPETWKIVYTLVFYNIHFLGFFHRTVSNLFFCWVTMKTRFTWNCLQTEYHIPKNDLSVYWDSRMQMTRVEVCALEGYRWFVMCLLFHGWFLVESDSFVHFCVQESDLCFWHISREFCSKWKLFAFSTKLSILSRLLFHKENTLSIYLFQNSG